MADPRLAELAVRHGVSLDYYDIAGRRHEASDATLRALLAAMRIEAADAAAVERSIVAHDRGRWLSAMPAAVVAWRAGHGIDVRIHVPDAAGARTFAWRVDDEQGAAHSGTFVPNELAVLGWETIDAVKIIARRLVLPASLAPGYHRLALTEAGATLGAAALIVAPERCYMPPVLASGARIWGPALQLYAVRSARDWGMGDLSDLGAVAEQWGRRGADLIGLNPLHALHPERPEHASPYSPSSRHFRNAMYLDVEAIEDFAESAAAQALVAAPAFQRELRRLRDAPLVDYSGVAAAKSAVLEVLYRSFRARHLAAGTSRATAFRTFQARGGTALRRHALFEALQERFAQEAPPRFGWLQWPEAYRDPASGAVASFEAAAIERVERNEYLQWQIEVQLGVAAARASAAGARVGLYQDLAVSADRGGAEVWSNRTLFADAAVGAPPDDFAPQGQDWGLPPMLPERLTETCYAPFIATLRANMAHAGALRIDHVMGLARLFWIPPGGKAAEGTYVRYPFAALLGIVTLESHRNRCVVIGEDLGTVPDEVREGLHRTGVLSYRLLPFEREADGGFKAPGRYPSDALAACGTHDLPTIVGWWEGRDLALRSSLGLVTDAAQRDAQLAARERDRTLLLEALSSEGLLPEGELGAEALALALQAYVASSEASVMVAQLEDAMGAAEQVNVPGTVDEHPNWRRKLPLAIETFEEDARLGRLCGAIREARRVAGPRP